MMSNPQILMLIGEGIVARQPILYHFGDRIYFLNHNLIDYF